MVEMVEDFGYMDMMENPEKSKKYFWFSYLEPLISQLINSMRLRNFQKGRYKDSNWKLLTWPIQISWHCSLLRLIEICYWLWQSRAVTKKLSVEPLILNKSISNFCQKVFCKRKKFIHCLTICQRNGKKVTHQKRYLALAVTVST